MGSRVVVRRILPGLTGPTGGPAFTDVLGVLERWDSSVEVRREDGTLVSFPTSLVVSGKPVPPRASPRLRVSTLDAERHTARLWPGVEVTRLGDWELRHGPRAAGPKRGNSALAIGSPGMPFDEAVDAVVAHYSRLGRPPLAQVEVGSSHDAGFLAAGWRQVGGGDAHFLLGSLARARRALRRSTTRVELSVSDNRATASTGTGCDPVAEGSATLDGEWLGLHGLSVDPAHRRRGLATAVVGELLGWGAEHGATTVWLHAEVDNEAAIALYEGLGLQVHHTCRYYSKESSPI